MTHSNNNTQPPDQHDAHGEAHRERERFFGATKIIAALTLLSRVFGLVRAMAIASLGTQALNDAFAFAFRVPNFFRRLFGEGALAAAFVPVFTEVNERDGHDAADRLLSNTLSLLLVALTILAAVMAFGVQGWLALGDSLGSANRLLAGLVTVMLPFMVTVCALGLASAALNCRGHFAYPAWAPVILNVVIIAAAWFVAPLWKDDLAGKLYVIAASVSVAGLVQLGGAWLLLRRFGYRLRLRLFPIEKPVRQIVRSMGPMLLGLGLLQLVELLETGLAWTLINRGQGAIEIAGLSLARPLEPGVLVRLDAARYLYQFPLGVLANSLAVAAFPLLARYGSRKDWTNLRSAVNRALRLALMEGLAAGAGLLVLAEPITRLIYVRGGFGRADAAQSARILQAYVIAMWAYCSYQILVRAFYSLKDTLTPLKISVTLMVLELVLVLSLVWHLGPLAFGITTATVFTLNALTLALLLRRRIGNVGARSLVTSVARSLLATAAMVGIIVFLRWVLPDSPALVVSVCVPAGAAVFIAAAWLLRAPELGEMLGSLGRKRKLDEPPTDADAPTPEGNDNEA